MPLRTLTILFLLLFVFPGQIHAQQCNTTFLSTVKLNTDAAGNAVVYTSDGNIVVAGQVKVNGKWDGLIMKTDPLGTPLWTRSFGTARNEMFVKVKETADKGFILTGSIEDRILPRIWVMKTDADGQMVWQRTISTEGVPHAGKDIIELSGGGYALIANLSDSTAQSDGLLLRLDENGVQIWGQIFDGGGADGFHSLLEMNGELLVTGFVTGDLKDAILMRAELEDGDPISTLQYQRFADHDEEGIALNAIPGGYSLGMKIAEKETGYDDYDTHLLTMKVTGGNNYVIQRQLLFPISGRRLKNLQVKPCAGDGFVYTISGEWYMGFPQIGRSEKDGRQEWSRDYKNTFITDFNGLDITGNNGYVVTGQTFDRAICLLKTDLFGIAGSCASNSYRGDGGGYDQVTGTGYVWKTHRHPPIGSYVMAMTVAEQAVGNTTVCANQYCDPAPPADNGDNCATSFLTTVKESYSTTLVDAVRTSDGDIMAIGSRSYYWSNRPQAIKLKPGGNVRWAKQINPKTSEDGYSGFTRVINTSDNNLLVVGDDAVVINHGVSDSVMVMKMDYDGNVLWAKRIAQWYSESVAAVQETEDGGFILALNQSYGSPPVNNVIIKLDRNGNLVWQKVMTGTVGGNHVIRSMIYDKGSIYLALDYYISYSGPNQIMITRLDGAAGEFRWAKQFKSDGEVCSILGLARIGDTLFVGTGLLKEISWENYQFHGAVVKLKDSDGSQMPGFRLSNPWMSTSKDYVWMGSRTAITFTKSLDDQLVIAHESAMNRDTTIRIHKMAPDGSVTWSRNFTQLKKHSVSTLRADGSGFLVTGSKYGVTLVNEAQHEGYVLRVNSKGEVEGGSGECSNSALAASPGGAYTTPLLLTETATDITGVTGVQLGATNKNVTWQESPALAYPSCATYSACQAATLQGPDMACDLGQTYIYEAQKPAGCTAPLTWQVDPLFADIVSQTGGQIILKFKKEGNTSVKAMLDAGCKVLATTLDVEVPQAAGKIDLGADTVLCKDATIRLDAGAGFLSYEWNDGSTLQTLDVNTPGTYRVTVTDKCNNESTDEIKVLDAGNFPFSLGPDILKCREASVTVALPAGFGDFSWNTDYNLTDKPAEVILFPETDTVYILQGGRGDGCLYKDTLRVKIQTPLSIGLPADQHICAGDSLELSAGNSFTNIVWGGGETGNRLMAGTAGEYTVSAKDANGCGTKDTFRLGLLPVPLVTLPKESYICRGTQQVLNAGSQGVSYAWSTGATTPQITVSTAGKWWVRVTGNNGCTATDTAWFRQESAGPQGFLPPDTLMCLRGEIFIPVKGSFAAYHWSDGSTTPQLFTQTPGVYWLEVTDQVGCTGREYINIGTKECGRGVYVPTAFTPNNDGTNDYLRPMVMGRVSKYFFSVFDRWGRPVFQSSEIGKGWDGKVNGMNAVTGAYIWTCAFQLEGEEEQISKGSAVLIR
ncbi:gliding motility-associated C-terminal domain-containing protein [Chitinophaga sp. 22620]|uniref:T9SS type B sorting domain-containing protein n=1 Tax=Chitinophaga sp. 22620 TaxID=3453952 RepID=UPI003F837A1A